MEGRDALQPEGPWQPGEVALCKPTEGQQGQVEGPAGMQVRDQAVQCSTGCTCLSRQKMLLAGWCASSRALSLEQISLWTQWGFFGRSAALCPITWGGWLPHLSSCPNHSWIPTVLTSTGISVHTIPLVTRIREHISLLWMGRCTWLEALSTSVFLSPAKRVQWIERESF